ncbi:putative cobalt transporter CbtA [Herbihabitans rhizosphaerae]|uniref:Putative cobalt transporter CbtA n=1 Tax=Herbihabitans rhizosphaerae TaxID=1872711 RepID=A0A4Q7L525_9PSEU|nr:CbtA family protein [Herbihabitans rhizosphaerae]RZS43621.1 putative cobalt transporter CbtA [Herbihabitans rhizosphaerae]
MPLSDDATFSVRALLVRGLIAGIVGGLLAFGFAAVFGEPSVERAIGLESAPAAHDHGDHATAPAEHEHAEEEVVSRGVQRTLGLATATGAYGLALGGLFALAFAVAYGRIGRLSPRGTVVAVGVGGFVAASLVPFLVYPPNPPAVGSPGTIGERTGLAFGMIGLSVLLAVLSVYCGRKLAARFDGWVATLLAGVGYVIVIGVLAAVLPGFDEVPPSFPASLLWDFRLASLGTQLTLWAGISLVFGVLLERGLRRESRSLMVTAG